MTSKNQIAVEQRKEDNAQYARGYQAGKKANAAQVTELQAEIAMLKAGGALTKRERMYVECLGVALQHCSGWSIGGKKINDSEGYAKLAKVFADHSITVLS
jgi:hypothetical protein